MKLRHILKKMENWCRPSMKQSSTQAAIV